MKWFAALVLPLALLALVVACEEEEEEPAAVTPSPAAAATAAASPETTPTPELEIPGYRVVTVEDISFANTVRFDVRAVTDFPITKAQAQAVMDKIIDEISSETPLNAVVVFLYHFEELSDGVFTLAKAEFAPDGDWAKADQVETGDYGRHETVYEYKPKLDDPNEALAIMPTSQECALYTAFWEAAMEAENPDISDEEIAQIVAEDVEASPQDILGAFDKCSLWIFR